ncbi:MAG TPA: hypothetical protein VFU14_19990, partial [Acidimicrobiales bacterium]|nr:hypothetical protein [Acidimicrobiales bacterium]
MCSDWGIAEPTPTPAPPTAVATPLDRLPWVDCVVRELPGDPRTEVHPRQVPGAAWSPVRPTPVRAPRLRAWSAEVATQLGLPAEPDAQHADALAQVLAGNDVVAGTTPR